MKKICLYLSTLFLISPSLLAQEKQFEFFVQGNPTLGYNNYSTKGLGETQMTNPAFNLGFGFEAVLPVHKKFQLVPFLKWSNISQTVETRETYGFFNSARSYVKDVYTHWNQGLLIQVPLVYDGAAKLSVLGGLSYSLVSRNEWGSGGSYSWMGNGSFDQYEIETNSISQNNNNKMTAGFANLAAGFRLQFNVRPLGDFQVGTLLYIPLGSMPETHFRNRALIKGVEYLTETYTSNKRYNLELTIGYRIFGLKA